MRKKEAEDKTDDDEEGECNHSSFINKPKNINMPAKFMRGSLLKVRKMA